MTRPLSSRKLDIAYLVFFIIHILVMLGFDLVGLYPKWLQMQWMLNTREWYIAKYKDMFFVRPPAWFTLYAQLELIYHLPLSIWAIGALIQDKPKLPVHLLVYACETTFTTMTCVADFLSWSDITSQEKLGLATLYVPYLALGIFMGVDMFARLSAPGQAIENRWADRIEDLGERLRAERKGRSSGRGEESKKLS